jgi:GT2 family glycosyltransferase
MFENDKCAAVIVTNGVNPKFLACVDSVVNQSYTPDQIYIVDVAKTPNNLNSIIDSANQGLAENNFPTSITLYHNPSANNFAQAVNSLIWSEYFNHDHSWIWLLHEDSIADPDTLNALINEVQMSETVGVVGSKQIDHDTQSLINVGYTTSASGRRISLIGRDQVDQGQYAKIEDVLSVSLNGALVSLPLFKKLKGLNPLLSTGDSLEFCRRVHLSGHRVIVSSGASVDHYRQSFNELDLYKARKAELIYRLGSARIFASVLLWFYFFFENIFLSIRQLYSDNKGSLKVLGGGIAGIFSFRSIFKVRSLARKAKTVPRSVLKSLYATRKEIKFVRKDRRLEESADLWEEFQPTLLQSETLHELRKKRRVAFVTTLVLLVALTVLHFYAFAGDLVSGGHFVSSALSSSEASALDAFNAATSGFSDVLFGVNAPVNMTVLPIAFLSIFTGSVQLTINILIVLSILLAGLIAWFASGAATRNNSARILASLIWVCLPNFLGSIDEGRVSAILTHILLPLVPLLIARGLGKTATDLDLGAPKLTYNFPLLGIVLAVIIGSAPILTVGLVAGLIVAGFFNRRFWFALIPVIVLNIWLWFWVIKDIAKGSWQIFTGYPQVVANENAQNPFYILFGTSSVSNPTAIICVAIILFSAISMLMATRTARIVLARLCWLVSVLAIFVAIFFAKAYATNVTPLISLAYLAFGITILIFQKQRVEFEKKALLVYIPTGIVVIALTAVYIFFGAVSSLTVEADYELPMVSQKIHSEEGNPRVLVINDDNDGLSYDIVSSRTHDFIFESDPARIILDSTNPSDEDIEVRQAMANMISAPTAEALQRLEILGIKAIFVPEENDEALAGKHIALLRSIDATPGIVRIIEGDGRAFWRLPLMANTDQSTITWDNSDYQNALLSPLRFIFLSIFSVFLIVFIILSLPLGKRKVIKYDV